MSQQKITSPSFIGEYKLENLNICDELIEFHKKDPLKRKVEGKVGANFEINEEVKSSKDVSLYFDEESINKVACPVLELYLEELQNILNKYKEEYIYSDRVAKYAIIEGMNIQHYEPKGGFYKWHTERYRANNRHLVFMTYLNDVPNGGTEFYYQNYTTKAIKGKTLIWPSDWTHTHRGQISDTHEKYITTGWYSYL